MKIYIASDHAGFLLKNQLVEYLSNALQYQVEDCGAQELVPTDDYPDFIKPCVEKAVADNGALAIVLGGSGQGEAIAANKVKGARCALFYGEAKATGAIDAEGAPALDGYDIVRLAREHNDANVLSIAARFVSKDTAKEACRVFIEAQFTGEERHLRRIKKLERV